MSVGVSYFHGLRDVAIPSFPAVNDARSGGTPLSDHFQTSAELTDWGVPFLIRRKTFTRVQLSLICLKMFAVRKEAHSLSEAALRNFSSICSSQLELRQSSALWRSVLAFDGVKTYNLCWLWWHADLVSAAYTHWMLLRISSAFLSHCYGCCCLVYLSG